jgi:hypothetical protein
MECVDASTCTSNVLLVMVQPVYHHKLQLKLQVKASITALGLFCEYLSSVWLVSDDAGATPLAWKHFTVCDGCEGARRELSDASGALCLKTHPQSVTEHWSSESVPVPHFLV